MTRSNRLAILGAAVLLLAVAGGALANRGPAAPATPAQVTSEHEDEATEHEDEAPTAEDIAHAAERLRASDIEVDDAVLNSLAAEYGVGGAVRLYAWADEETSIEDLRAMRDEGKGWGVMARELGRHPGIGSIMGNGGGHGRENAPGQQGDRGSDD